MYVLSVLADAQSGDQEADAKPQRLAGSRARLCGASYGSASTVVVTVNNVSFTVTFNIGAGAVDLLGPGDWSTCEVRVEPTAAECDVWWEVEDTC